MIFNYPGGDNEEAPEEPSVPQFPADRIEISIYPDVPEFPADRIEKGESLDNFETK